MCSSDLNGEGAVFAGRRYAKKRMEVEWTQVGKFSRAAMTAADIAKAVLELAQAQNVAYRGPQSKHIKVLATDLSGWKLKDTYVNHDGHSIQVYNCWGRHRHGCKAGFRVKYLEDYVIVEICFPHSAESHGTDKSLHLSVSLKQDIIQLIEEQPALSVRNIMQTFARRGREIPEEHFKSVSRLVKQHRPRVEAEATGSVRLDGSVGAFQQLADSLWIESAVER